MQRIHDSKSGKKNLIRKTSKCGKFSVLEQGRKNRGKKMRQMQVKENEKGRERERKKG